MSKSLIVSADDFGLSPGVNAGVVRAHRDGILTNASLMVTGEAFAEAVDLARAHPSLGVGLHLVLAQGRAVSRATEIPRLVDSQGMFGANPVWVGLRYFFHPGIRAELRREITAQLDRFRATGLDLSHVDGHLTIHMHPVVLEILLEVAAAYGIRCLRLPREPLLPALRYDHRHGARKIAEATAFHLLSRRALKRLAAARVCHADRVFGMHQTGHVDERYLLRVIDGLPEGASEIYCHAGVPDHESQRWRPAGYDGEAELAGLLSPNVRTALTANGIQLTSYRELAGMSG